MNQQDFEAQKARSNRRWNIIIFISLIAFAPAGVAMFVAKLLGILPNIGGRIDFSELGKSASDVWQKAGASRAGAQQKPPERTASETARPAENKAAADKTPAEKQNEKLPAGSGAIMALGGIAAAAGAGFGTTRLVSLLNSFSLGGLVATIGWFSLAAAGAVVAIFGGIRRRKRRRFEAYLKLIGNKEYVSIHELADVLGMDYRKVMKDLKEMIQRGILSPAWLDMKTYRLMLTEYTGETVSETKEEFVPRSDRILRQIRADNDLIDDPEVSRKIDRIEDLTRKIFAIVDKFPEKEAQLYSFLNYYLPTTLKTLESYARLEAQGIETASIREAKQKINLMLDELADGYEKQLDRLFENDVVDISADIEVMRQMLQKDGLTEDEILKQTAK